MREVHRVCLLCACSSAAAIAATPTTATTATRLCRAVVRSCSRAPCLNISSYYCGLRGCPDSGRGRYQSALPHLGWRGGILRGLPKAASGRRHITLRIPAGYVGIDGKTRNNEIQQHYLKLPSFRAPFISGKAVAKMLSWLQRSGPICFHELFLR